MCTQDSTPPRESQTTEKRIPIYSGSRIVGEVHGSTFRKSVQGSKHFLRQPRAIASDDSVLTDARRAGAVDIAVRDSETGLVYMAPIESFEKYGFPVRRGFGNQTGLPMARWAVFRNGKTLQEPKADSTPVEQYSLFDATAPMPFEKSDIT